MDIMLKAGDKVGRKILSGFSAQPLSVLIPEVLSEGSHLHLLACSPCCVSFSHIVGVTETTHIESYRTISLSYRALSGGPFSIRTNDVITEPPCFDFSLCQ